MARYELTYLTRSEEDQAGIPDLLAQLGARIETTSTLGRRKLTYPIHKEAVAAYFTLVFDIDPTNLPELNQKLLRNEGVLRHLLIADGIRKGEEPVRKLKEKDLEVPASVQAGFQETTTAPATAAALDQALDTPTVPADASTSNEPSAGRDAEGITAEERQKKLDEKLKQILGE